MAPQDQKPGSFASSNSAFSVTYVLIAVNFVQSREELFERRTPNLDFEFALLASFAAYLLSSAFSATSAVQAFS